MVTCPDQWANSIHNEYKFAEIRYQLGKPPAPGEIWGNLAGNTTPIADGLGGVYYLLTDRNALNNVRNAFAYARILSIETQIEWLGSLDQGLDVGTLEAQQVGPDLIRKAKMEYRKAGTSLRYKLCHERFQKQMDDGQNGPALAPANMLGWNQLPVLYYPDKIDLPAGRGTVAGANLMQPGICKVLRFTQEHRFASVKWKPLSRADKIAATFDIRKTTSAGWDSDQRTGALWLAQDTWINSTVTATPFQGLDLTSSATTCDFFRFTFKVNWKFFRRLGLGQAQP